MDANINTSTPNVQPQQKSSNSAMVVGLIAAIVGLAIGFGVAKAMPGTAVAPAADQAMKKDATPADKMATAPMTDTKAADLRVLLNSLEKEHVDLAAAATRAGFDGSPSFNAVAGQLDVNSKALAAAVGSVYGQPAGDEFYKLWASHIGFFVDYTVAAKKGDKAGQEKAVKDLLGYVEGVSDFFSQANPNLPRAAVKQLVTDHVLLLKAAVDAHGAGDYATSYAKQHEAHEQIGKIADAQSGAIVKQFPDKFK